MPRKFLALLCCASLIVDPALAASPTLSPPSSAQWTSQAFINAATNFLSPFSEAGERLRQWEMELSPVGFSEKRHPHPFDRWDPSRPMAAAVVGQEEFGRLIKGLGSSRAVDNNKSATEEVDTLLETRDFSAHQLIELGNLFSEKEMLYSALVAYQKAWVAQPSQGHRLLVEVGKAVIGVLENRLEHALSRVNGILAIRPDYERGRALLSGISMKKQQQAKVDAKKALRDGEWWRAAVLIDEALELRSDEEARRLRDDIIREVSPHDKALLDRVDLMETADELVHGAKVAYVIGQKNLAVKLAEQAVEKTQGRWAEALLVRGHTLLGAGRLQDAASLIASALETIPNLKENVHFVELQNRLHHRVRLDSKELLLRAGSIFLVVAVSLLTWLYPKSLPMTGLVLAGVLLNGNDPILNVSALQNILPWQQRNAKLLAIQNAVLTQVRRLQKSKTWHKVSNSARLKWLITETAEFTSNDLGEWEELLEAAGLRLNANRLSVPNPQDAVITPNGGFRILKAGPNAPRYLKLSSGIHDCLAIALYNVRHHMGMMLYPHVRNDIPALFDQAFRALQNTHGSKTDGWVADLIGGFMMASRDLGLAVLKELEKRDVRTRSLDFLNGLDRFIWQDAWENERGDRSIVLDVRTGQVLNIDFAMQQESPRVIPSPVSHRTINVWSVSGSLALGSVIGLYALARVNANRNGKRISRFVPGAA